MADAGRGREKWAETQVLFDTATLSLSAGGNHLLSLGLKCPIYQLLPPKPAPLLPSLLRNRQIYSPTSSLGVSFSHVPLLLTPHVLSVSLSESVLAPTLSGPCLPLTGPFASGLAPAACEPLSELKLRLRSCPSTAQSQCLPIPPREKPQLVLVALSL